MKYWALIIILLLIIVIFTPTSKTEDFSATEIQQEAILNIASVYNKENLRITNVTATGNITADDMVTNTFNPTNWKGIIVAFSGDTPPKGWAFCDGKNNTPDLRDRFILGKSDKSKIGNTGGEKNHTLTIDEIPAHTHTVSNVPTYDRHCGNSSSCAGYKGRQTTSSTGGGKAHNNMPPYYVLAYIIKL